MTTYKTIIKGRLEFGTSKSYDKVFKMYQHRVENYYKMDVLLKEDPEKEEHVFDEASLSLDVPRLITQSTIKTWKNTVSLLEYLAQFAVTGSFYMWMTENGTILREAAIEPQSDKGAVQAFIKGRNLIQEGGKEDEAMTALNQAIKKYERHAFAYERRGFINLKLKNYDDALYDFSKSIDVNPNIPDPHIGKAKVLMLKKKHQEAVADLGQAIKKSIPLEPIYWQGRRMKADCHIQLEEFDKAVFELKLFTKRKFTTDNPNYKYRKDCFFKFGKSLLEIGEYEESLKAFNASMEIDKHEKNQPDADQYLYRGIARQRVGENGFTKDWSEAAELGSEEASKLLAELA